MTLAIAAAYIAVTTARRQDLTLKINQIQNARQALSNQAAQISQQLRSFEPGSPQMQQLQQQLQAIQRRDKLLEQEAQRIDIQLQAENTRGQALDRTKQQATRAFSLLGGGGGGGG